MNAKAFWIGSVIRMLRPHQWVKNTLIFVPILINFPASKLHEYMTVIMTFMMFCLLASTGYIINDIIDRERDRKHHEKKNRPIASGQVTIRLAVYTMFFMLTAFASLASIMPLNISIVGACYLFGTLSYSLIIKNIPMLDVLCLALLYSIRIVAGQVAINQPVSFWLLTFSVFFFLSLAVSKRCAELSNCRSREDPIGFYRPYSAGDLSFLVTIGVNSIIASNLVFAVYLIEEQFPREIYNSPHWLWLVLPLLLYWGLRVWYITIGGSMQQDFINFAIRDRTSWIILLGVGAVMVMAWGM